MKLATIQKLGGFALIAGAILFATYSVLFLSLFPAGEIHRDFSRIVLSPPWIGVAAVAFAGVVLMVFGFAAVYSRLHQGAGALGLVGRLHRRSPTCCKPARSRGRSSIAGKPSSATLLRDGILRDHPLVHAFKAGASATIYGCATVAPADSLTPNTCRSIRSSPLSPNTRTPVASRDCGWSLR